MGAAVVQDDMKSKLFWRCPLHLRQEIKELLGPVTLGYSAHHLARLNDERCIQAHGAIALVFVGTTLNLARFELQHRLRPVKCRNLGLLVHRQYNRILGTDEPEMLTRAVNMLQGLTP